jgi:hypothetical protein
MQSHIIAKFSEMVVNLDEVGSSDSDNRTPRKALAHVTVSADDVFHPVSHLLPISPSHIPDLCLGGG